jgi:hypothetical protein
MHDKLTIETEMLDILEIAEKVVSKTHAFKVDEKNYREWRMSIISIAKLVQDQYNRSV